MKSARILLIEATDDVRAVIQTSLELLSNWTVIAVASADEGLAIALVDPPDLIMLDEEDAVSRIQLFHAVPALQHTPVIVLAPRVRLTDQVNSSQHGAIAILEKPFDPAALCEEIKRVLYVSTALTTAPIPA